VTNFLDYLRGEGEVEVPSQKHHRSQDLRGERDFLEELFRFLASGVGDISP
jgi:hypothetical protein